MRKLLAAVTVLSFLVMATSCGTPGGEDGPTQEPSGGVAEATPTPAALATPTPRPAPPTPTPIEQGEEVEGSGVADVMIEIPAGPFIMGSDEGDPEDGPAHSVDLPAYEIDKFEVTNADFEKFVEATGYVTYAEEQEYRSWRDEWSEGEDNHPVVMITWNDASAYCEWLDKRLPSEAEWEKAARGDDGRIFPWGDEWDPDKANVKERGLRGTAAVGSFGVGASPYGVEDVVGNVWEWTADWYEAYPGNTAGDPYYGEKFKVTRGGGWFEIEPQATTFNRNAADLEKTAIDELGCRCAR